MPTMSEQGTRAAVVAKLYTPCKALSFFCHHALRIYTAGAAVAIGESRQREESWTSRRGHSRSAAWEQRAKARRGVHLAMLSVRSERPQRLPPDTHLLPQHTSTASHSTHPALAREHLCAGLLPPAACARGCLPGPAAAAGLAGALEPAWYGTAPSVALRSALPPTMAVPSAGAFASSSDAAQHVVHAALAPRLAVLASPDVDAALLAPNGLPDFAALLRPFESSIRGCESM